MALYSQKASGEAWIFLHNKFSVKSKKMYKRDFQKINLPMKVCLQYFIPYTLESGNKVSVITRHSRQFTWALYFFCNLSRQNGLYLLPESPKLLKERISSGCLLLFSKTVMHVYTSLYHRSSENLPMHKLAPVCETET